MTVSASCPNAPNAATAQAALFESTMRDYAELLSVKGAFGVAKDLWATEHKLRDQAPRNQRFYSMIFTGVLDALEIIHRKEKAGRPVSDAILSVMVHGIIALNHHDPAARLLTVKPQSMP